MAGVPLPPLPRNIFRITTPITLRDLQVANPINILVPAPVYPPVSIFTNMMPLIDNFINKNNIDRNDLNNNNEMAALDTIFNNLDIAIPPIDGTNFLNRIYNFCKSFYDIKYLFINKKQNFFKFSSLLRQLNMNKNLFTKKIIYENPNIYFNFASSCIHYPELNNILDSYNIEERNAIDNIILGNQINFSLPSIGPIYSIYTTPYPPAVPAVAPRLDISSLIYKLILIDGLVTNPSPNFLNFIPIYNQNIYETLSNILLNNNNNENNIWNIKIGNSSSNNNKTLKYIKQYFRNISISLEDIFYIKPNEINHKYTIPYTWVAAQNSFTFTNSKDPTTGIAAAVQNTKIRTIINENNELLQNLIGTNVFTVGVGGAPDILNNNNVKEFLCCYVFFVINLFYDFYKKYIDKLNEVMINISKTKLGKNLNFVSGFNYIERLNESLLYFKKILLNNFYELFLPSSIIKNNYGMKTIDATNNRLIPEDRLLAENQYIINNFPFRATINNAYFDANIQTLVNFIFLNKSNKDIYDSDLSLCLGGFSYNKMVTNNSIKILNEYFNNYSNKKNNLNIYLLELLEDIFKNSSCEKFNYYLIANILQVAADDIKKKKMEKYFEKTLLSSTKYIIEYMKIDRKIKLSKNNINNEEYIKKNIYLLTSRILAYNSEICKSITSDQALFNPPVTDITRRELFKYYDKYQQIATDKLLYMKKMYTENAVIKRTINSKPINLTLNSSYWISFKSKILNKKLLIPILNTKKSEIIFIDLIEFAINGKYSNDLIFVVPKKINENYITGELMNNCIILFGKTITDIKKNKFITLKSDFLDKIKLINDVELIRKNLFKLLTDIILFNKYVVEISSSLEIYSIFKTFIKDKSNNFNKLIISHIQVKKIAESI
jgi:hypothetical protein